MLHTASACNACVPLLAPHLKKAQKTIRIREALNKSLLQGTLPSNFFELPNFRQLSKNIVKNAVNLSTLSGLFRCIAFSGRTLGMKGHQSSLGQHQIG
jgi:hypothetical protein